MMHALIAIPYHICSDFAIQNQGSCLLSWNHGFGVQLILWYSYRYCQKSHFSYCV